MPEKFLPIGIQDFEFMRQGNFVYVDKTEYIYQLVRPPQAFYFLSRPRRFGKSLMVSTLAYLFQGREDLFEGLWIHEKTDWQWTKYPVVKIDLNGNRDYSPDELKSDLWIQLKKIARQKNIDIDSTFVNESFAQLIIKLKEKYENDVVMLVDGFHNPLLNHIGKGNEELEIARKKGELIDQVFGVLKDGSVSGALRLVFVTSTVKFSLESIFSGLNNLMNISMDMELGTLLGFTDEELEKYFNKQIEELSAKLGISYQECKEQLKSWYNGYQFTIEDEKVYNPFSVLKALVDQDFQSHWFETGAPSYVINLIREKNYPIAAIENLQLAEDTFTINELGRLQLEALLFQTGYITIKSYDGIFYHLNYPNQEVKISFLKNLYDELVEIKDSTLKDSYKILADQLQKNDLDGFIKTINAILSSIPYTQIANQDESYYHTIFYLMLSASGVLVLTEVLTSKGRTDIAVEFSDKVYVIELKCNQSADKAIAQIKEKKYADKYQASGRVIYVVGINFDTSEREIADWKIEKLTS